MAERPSGRRRTLRLEYQFDRLWTEKLAQAYEYLVPDPIRRGDRAATGGVAGVRG